MLPITQIGPVAIQTAILIIFTGLWIGISLARKYSPLRGIDPNDLEGLILTSFFAGLLGGRLSYVLTYPSAFMDNPSSLISPNPALIRSAEGIVIGVLAAMVYGSRKQLGLWKSLDALTPFFLVLWVTVGLANTASGNAYGIATDLPWAVEMWGAKRHPIQIYETILASILLIILWPDRKLLRNKPAGFYFLSATGCGAFSRLLLAPLQGEFHLLPGGIRSEQITALIILTTCIILLQKIAFSPLQETGDSDR